MCRAGAAFNVVVVVFIFRSDKTIGSIGGLRADATGGSLTQRSRIRA